MPLNGGPEARVLDKPNGKDRFNALRGERIRRIEHHGGEKLPLKIFGFRLAARSS
jgi:hypothetical protein